MFDIAQWYLLIKLLPLSNQTISTEQWTLLSGYH